eukprot:jgi/Ulvmu1/304/UM001_0308.1
MSQQPNVRSTARHLRKAQRHPHRGQPRHDPISHALVPPPPRLLLRAPSRTPAPHNLHTHMHVHPCACSQTSVLCLQTAPMSPCLLRMGCATATATTVRARALWPAAVSRQSSGGMRVGHLSGAAEWCRRPCCRLQWLGRLPRLPQHKHCAGAPAASEFLRKDGEDAWAYARRVYDLVYVRDIERVAGIPVLWETRKPPKPLQPAAAILGDIAEPSACEGTDVVKFLGLNPREEWTVEETARVLIAAVYIFHARRPADIGGSHFTKDDPLAVAVVAAAANLRAHAYGIPRQSQFAAMGMAGNIIHAIATTNAVVAGMVTLEATKLLAGCDAACRTTFLSGAIPNVYGKLSFASAVREPNPACLVCGHAVASVSLDLETFTLQKLVEELLKKRMAFNCPMIVADDFLYEEGDDLEEDEVEENKKHLPCVLAKLPGGMQHNARLHVTDQSQNMKLTLVLQQAVLDVSEHPDGYVLEGSTPVAKADEASQEKAAEEPKASPVAPGSSAGVDGVIDILSDDDASAELVTKGTKRKAGDDGAGPSTKTAKMDDIIELD